MPDNSKNTTKKTAASATAKSTASASKAKTTPAAKSTAAKKPAATATAKPVAKSAPAKSAAKPAKETAAAKKDVKKPADTKTVKKETAPKADAKQVKDAKPAKAEVKNSAKGGGSLKAAAAASVAPAAKKEPQVKAVEPAKETKAAKEIKPAKKEDKQVEKEVKAEKKSPEKKKDDKSKAQKSSDKALKRAKESGGGKAEVAAATVPDHTKRNLIIIGILILLILLITIVSVTATAVSANKVVTVNAYKSATRVGYSAQYLGSTERNKPVKEIKNEGLSKYPTYGSQLKDVLGTEDDKVAAREALIAESSYLAAFGTAGANRGGEVTPDKYTWMNKDGMLFRGTVDDPVKSIGKDGQQRQLYQHTASVGLYLGDVADNEPGIIKKVTMMPRGYSSYGVTGVYAPAGEVVKVTLSEEDMKATGGIVIHIGQALYNGQANNIWSAKNQMCRMPHVLTTLVMDKTTMTYDEDKKEYTGYIGSFLGGPVFIRNEGATFSVTISGGVTYSHFILGYTTPEEFEKNNKSSAPYFDLEVWEYGALHSGPKKMAAAFNYDDLYKAAVLWEKVSLLTTQRGGGYKQGIVFIYDPFVAAGAAVAFPGRSSVNCPTGWMTSSLNYKSVITSGSWGNFHEYHHNFQGFGVGGGADGEVTNNSLTLVSYSQFTKISSSRRLASYGGAGLSGWNCYTSATWALNQVKNGAITSTNGLAVYSTLLHNFGADAFIKNAKGSNDQYWKNWSEYTHYDMSYYAELVKAYAGGSNPAKLHTEQSQYSMFVPVSSVYQTGRSYTYDGEKKYFDTMQPYVIPYGEACEIDLSPYTVNDDGQYLSGSVVIPAGFTYKIKEVKADGINGTFEKTDNEYIYKFTPHKKEMLSGKIYVTLEITNNSATVAGQSFTVDDVDLVLEFEQSHESKKAILERTTYTYDAGKAYTDAVEAFNANYKGYASKQEGDNLNPTQNSNTDIWYYPRTTEYLQDEKKAKYVVPENSVVELRGKLYIDDAGKYRIVLRGRLNCALFLSTDGETYEQAAIIRDKNTSINGTANFRLTDSNGNQTYVDKELEAKSWLHFKMIMITSQTPMVSYIGLGIAQWEVPLYTIDENGKYYDKSGKEVTAEQASNVDPIMPTKISYATAFRSSYDFVKEFTSDYFYKRSYDGNYTDNVSVDAEEYTLINTNYTATGYGKGMPIENLTDGKTNTYIHTSWRPSVGKPLELEYDLGEKKTVNRLTVYARNHNGMHEGPKDFTLFGSLDGKNYDIVGEFYGAPEYGNQTIVNFDDTTFRSFKLVITASHSNNYYCVLGEIILTHANEVMGGKMYTPDDDMFTYRGAGKWSTKSVASNFGHVYYGKNKASVEFEFEGSRVGIMSSTELGGKFEVTVDGKKVQSISLKKPDGTTFMAYLSPELASGKNGDKHKVKITCSGKSSIDSIILYPPIKKDEN